MFEGSLDAKILFVSDFLRVSCKAEGRILSESLRGPLEHAIKTAGLTESEISFYCLHPEVPPGAQDVERLSDDVRWHQLALFKEFLRQHKANVIVPLGEYALNQLTGEKGIGKWHCSPISLTADLGARKAIPLLHPSHIMKVYNDHAYLAVGCHKIAANKDNPKLQTPEVTCHTTFNFDQAIDFLRTKVAAAPEVALDLEFGQGQINTVGFAISENEAVAIKTLPGDYTEAQHWQLWCEFQKILENGDQPKIIQHFITEASWLARYGIELKGLTFDTMWAMKFLHPELEKGLDNVGRLYTDFPYWKDDNDDWNNIRDWQRHLRYNCSDTLGTMVAAHRQQKTLKQRGLSDLFNKFVMRFADPIYEMCCRGLLVDPQQLVSLKDKLERERDNCLRIIEDECQAKLSRSINPRSPAQVKAALKDFGMKLPTKRVKGESEEKESSDKKALIKLKKKYPDSAMLGSLITLSAKNKQLSSYVNFEYDRATNRVHYSLDGCGTETGRWAGYQSPWGEGFNPQTIPKTVRTCYVAEPGKVLVQVDLSQAESRYVAWESPEPKLMELLSSGKDIHRYVAAKIFKKPEELITKKERDLGKKSGHAANYDVGPRTFAEACLTEMDLFISEKEAKDILATYNQTFPGIQKRKFAIQKTLRQFRMLKTPMGRERHFFGRMNDATFREAYAYAPQSTIPDIMNCFMLKLWDLKDAFDVEFLLQVHDSLLLQVPLGRQGEIRDFARDLDAWHPKIMLAGGQLRIPVDVEVGERWHPMEKI